jgi:tripartite-type tricarboxylate transporter receptor subunit TctC
VVTPLLSPSGFLFAAAPGTVDYIRSGKLRALAVTSATSTDVLKDLPMIARSVPGYDASQWCGIAAPKNTPAEIVGRLNKEINAAFADATMTSRFAAIRAIRSAARRSSSAS